MFFDTQGNAIYYKFENIIMSILFNYVKSLSQFKGLVYKFQDKVFHLNQKS